MTYIGLGFITGFSLILAIGAQNIFVIEQGIKKQFVFLVCLICAVSDMLLIFSGIFLFEYFQNFFNQKIELIFNLLLLFFLLYFIISKFNEKNEEINLNITTAKISLKNVVLKTLGFTFFNPHVYSDTVFFLGNFSKNFLLIDKIYFGVGASTASFVFFYLLGYASNYFSNFLNNKMAWKIINWIIILIMSLIVFYVLLEILK
tara:strand:+ start:2438 stop:3046 length:609 start_codon:yes stop_codon:yes gene_type:complete